MSRYRPQTSRDHLIQRYSSEHYRLSWTVDRYIKGSRLRYPTRYTRDTDERGAKRFAKRWELEVPGCPPSA